MAEDEIMIEDEAIALEDTEDSVQEDAGVSSIIGFVTDRFYKAKDYRLSLIHI